MSDEVNLKHLKKQLHFYFSEGNLPKDEFMQNCMNNSKYSSVPISDLLKFNKLIKLNANEDSIKKAVKKSKILTLDESNTGVKRKIELAKLKPLETRSIFVCGFLNENEGEDHDNIHKRLKKLFKEFGQVLRIDLPSYGSSGLMRGFAFIEFMTKTAAKAALAKFKLGDVLERKKNSWSFLSYKNNQYNHLLKQMELINQPQKPFFNEILGDKRKDKCQILNAIAKKEWLIFRQEFYKKQKQHQDEMKDKLDHEYSKKDVKDQMSCSHKKHDREKVNDSEKSQMNNKVDLVRNIVRFKMLIDGGTKKSIKQELCEWNDKVEYLDYRDFAEEGWLRFKDEGDARRVIGEFMGTSLGEMYLLESEEELMEYQNRVEQSREARREANARKNNRKRKLDG